MIIYATYNIAYTRSEYAHLFYLNFVPLRACAAEAPLSCIGTYNYERAHIGCNARKCPHDILCVLQLFVYNDHCSCADNTTQFDKLHLEINTKDSTTGLP